MKCPVCETVVDKKYDYCRRCAWEFEYYFDELSDEERGRYEYRLEIQKNIYSHYLSYNNKNKKLFHTKTENLARSHPSSVGTHTRITITKPTSKNK